MRNYARISVTAAMISQSVDWLIERKFAGNYVDNQFIILVILKAKISNFCWFQLFKCIVSLLFFVI